MKRFTLGVLLLLLCCAGAPLAPAQDCPEGQISSGYVRYQWIQCDGMWCMFQSCAEALTCCYTDGGYGYCTGCELSWCTSYTVGCT